MVLATPIWSEDVLLQVIILIVRGEEVNQDFTEGTLKIQRRGYQEWMPEAVAQLSIHQEGI